MGIFTDRILGTCTPQSLQELARMLYDDYYARTVRCMSLCLSVYLCLCVCVCVCVWSRIWRERLDVNQRIAGSEQHVQLATTTS